MTVFVKQDESSVKLSNSVSTNKPSFLITDILAKAVDNHSAADHLKNLEQFSTVNGTALALNHAFGMQSKQNNYYDSDADDFHGSDDADGNSSVASNGK